MTTRVIRRLLASTAASVLVAGSLLIAAPASAATCTGTGCDGTDPINTGCSADAQPATYNPQYVMNGTTTLAVVELRWSPSCGTNWGRIHNRVSPNNTVKVWVYRGTTTTTKYGGTGTQYYGDQLYGRDAEVCVVGQVKTAGGQTFTSPALCA